MCSERPTGELAIYGYEMDAFTIGSAAGDCDLEGERVEC